MPKRRCLDCGTLTEGTRCHTCTTTQHRKRGQARAAREPWRLTYGHATWRQARQTALNRSAEQTGTPTCELRGCTETHKLDVHHIIPLNAGGTHHQTNLIVLCREHHNDIERATRQARTRNTP